MNLETEKKSTTIPTSTRQNTLQEDLFWMAKALELAKKAEKMKEVPVGAIVVKENKMIAQSFNRRETHHSPTAHAELMALEEASRNLGRWRLEDCTLYVTLEPCVMCAGAIVNSRIPRVVYGATDPKAGAVESLYQILSDARLNHRPEVLKGVLADECGDILTNFFKDRRKVPGHLPRIG